MSKIASTIKNIDQYHEAQPAEVRETLEELRQAIRQVAPLATETISYGMPAFRANKVLVYYALNNKHIGFYPTPNPIAHFKKELEGYKTSKGAIQFPIDQPLPLELIQKIVLFRVQEDNMESNQDVLPGIFHEMADDIEKALKENKDVLKHWNTLTPIQRNEWICWVSTVKKPETRLQHILRMVDELKEGKRIPCCWPGCPHRRPSAQKWFKNAVE